MLTGSQTNQDFSVLRAAYASYTARKTTIHNRRARPLLKRNRFTNGYRVLMPEILMIYTTNGRRRRKIMVLPSDLMIFSDFTMVFLMI